MALTAVLVLSSVGSLVMALRFVGSVRDLQGLQLQAAQAQRDRALVTALVNDAVEYGKRNPAINPLLETVGLKLKAAGAQPGTPTPATAPAAGRK
jgi:hypothetical protein